MNVTTVKLGNTVYSLLDEPAKCTWKCSCDREYILHREFLTHLNSCRQNMKHDFKCRHCGIAGADIRGPFLSRNKILKHLKTCACKLSKTKKDKIQNVSSSSPAPAVVDVGVKVNIFL